MSKVRILSIDGGGIRGVIPATVLKYVEEQLIIKSGNPNARLADYFDFVAGTSTGGILTCFYLTPGEGNGQPNFKFKAEKALNFYVNDGYSIFNASKNSTIRWTLTGVKYNPKKLESLLKSVFQDSKLSELGRPCLVTTYDMEKADTMFFNSTEANANEWDMHVRDVARSTSAAPTYFPPAMVDNIVNKKEKMVNLDGGVFANNPAMCAYAECRESEKEKLNNKVCNGAGDMLILSVGTGAGEIDLNGYKKSNIWSLLKWAKTAPSIMMDGAADAVAFQMQQIFHTLEPINQKNFLRVDVPKADRKGYEADMADASPENIANLKIAANKALQAALVPNNNSMGLDAFIDELLKPENQTAEMQEVALDSALN